MSKKIHRRVRLKRHGLPGSPPGTMSVDSDSPQPVIRVMAYGPHEMTEHGVANPDDLRKYLEQWPVCWVNVDGLGDAHILQKLGDIFGLHPLAMEDVVNVHQRAKVETYGEQQFIVMHMVQYHEHLEFEQVSMFLTKNFVLTFQERPGWDCLEPVRDRIRKQMSHIRETGPGYLAYAILDAVIDHYFPVLEAYGERLEALEDRIVFRPTQGLTAEIHTIKRELLNLRRTIWPQREAINALLRDPISAISDETRLYIRDCYDHAVRIIDLVETYREVCSDLMDLYLSSLSIRMNEIMKVLTVISTLFMPLTFVVGVYGMNFNSQGSSWNMPELQWQYGYPACLGVMVLISLCQLFYFYRKGWIGSGGKQAAVQAGADATIQANAEAGHAVRVAQEIEFRAD